jgi:diguanylate cyclase (GGDEF)-like protein
VNGKAGEPLARPRVLLVGEASARPAGLERALTRAGFQLVEREEPSSDPDADAILITLPDINQDPVADLLPTVSREGNVVPPRIVLLSTTNPDAPAAALALGAADALGAPVHLPELCARLYARIRDRQEAAGTAQPGQTMTDSESIVAGEAGTLDPDDIVLGLVRRLARSLDLAHCSFVAIKPGDDRGRIVAEIQRPAAADQVDLTLHPEITEAIRTRRTVVKPVHAKHVSDTPRTLIVIPAELNDHVSGTLLLRTREAHRHLTSAQLELAAGLARAAALALNGGHDGSRVDSDAALRQAASDAGTGLEALDRRVQEEFERARRYSLSFSLILLGVDELPAVEGRAGPEAAEQLSQSVGTVLRRELRVPDFVVPYSGSEFALVLPETGQIGARQSVLRVRERLAALPAESDPRDERPRFSAGIVTYPHPAVTQSDDLYALVEAALMRGKAQVGERIGVAL